MIFTSKKKGETGKGFGTSIHGGKKMAWGSQKWKGGEQKSKLLETLKGFSVMEGESKKTGGNSLSARLEDKPMKKAFHVKRKQKVGGPNYPFEPGRDQKKKDKQERMDMICLPWSPNGRRRKNEFRNYPIRETEE